MISAALAYVAAALTVLWGAAHAVPTLHVLSGFEPITADNRRVLLQEWLAEAFTMWGAAALVITMTVVASGSLVTHWSYRVVACLLLTLGALTALTGARTEVLWFKVCPVLLGVVAALLLAASFV